MHKEDVVYTHTHTHTHTHNGVLLSRKKELKLAICNDMDGTREYYAKRNKSVGERQIPYDFTHMQNLRNKTKGKEERDKPRNRLLTVENKLMVPRGGMRGTGEIGDTD